MGKNGNRKGGDGNKEVIEILIFRETEDDEFSRSCESALAYLAGDRISPFQLHPHPRSSAPEMTA
jgi:hypothetical protein